MLTYHTIAVGTDGSETSLRAVRSAASMARAYDAKLIIVSAAYNHSGSMLGAPSGEGSRLPVVSEEMADTYLTNAQRIAESEGAENIEVVTTPGDPVNALIEVTEKYDVELLVVGNRGVNSVRGRVLARCRRNLPINPRWMSWWLIRVKNVNHFSLLDLQ